ncbi:hypothetical protein B0H34DRAFT_780604 [Crassisporium funariophilum]|nr:hypothetical protein B0H34DRAFT_780604 [Crassisporium funariophilum]
MASTSLYAMLRPELVLNLTKCFVGTPTTEENKRKRKAAKEKKDAKKTGPSARSHSTAKLPQAQAGPLMESAGLSDTASIGDDRAEDNAVKDSPKKTDNDDNIGDSSSKRQKKDVENITAYIDETTVTRGPFFFTLGTSHREFLQLLAACAVKKNFIPAVSSINQNQLFWKLLVPANDKKKPLYNEQGYQALITKLNALSEKGKELSVTLLMPPMLRTRQGDEGLQNGPMGSTIREQKAVIGTGNAPFVEKIRQKYPVGHDVRWPTKRVYTSADGRSWELNDLRMQVWASHLAASPPTASLNVPPTSTHFADSQKLRASSEAATGVTPAPEPVPAAIGAPPGPYFNNYPPPYGFPGYPPAPPHHYPPQYPYYPPYYQQPPPDPRGHYVNVNGNYPQPLRRGADGPNSAPPSPVKVVLPRPVALSEFCEHYEIDADDEARLAKLKFQPGDRRIEKLGREDWQGYAGFSKLAWDDVVTKHKVFLCDVKGGCFV